MKNMIYINIILLLFALTINPYDLYAVENLWINICEEFTSSQDWNLNAVWGRSTNDVYAVGQNGTILHFEGNGKCSKMESNTDEELNSIWGNSNYIYAVGDNGVILTYVNNQWNVESKTVNWFNGIWSIDNQLFVVGSAGIILHYDGNSWVEQPNVTFNELNSVWGTAVNNVYAVGNSGTLLFYDGSEWVNIMTSTFIDFHCIHGVAENNIFLVGFDGTIRHFQGVNWNSVNSGTSVSLNSLWALSDTLFYTVGRKGTILKYQTEEDWSIDNSNTSSINWNGVWGSSSALFLVGDDGKFMYHPPSLVMDIDERTVNEGQEKIQLTINGESNLVVNLKSNNNKVVIPDYITIPENQTYFYLDITIVNNSIIDGNQSATISASANGWNDCELIINILDNENFQLSADVPDKAIENEGLLENSGKVYISAPFYKDLIISLISSDIDQEILSVPETVTINKGYTSAKFDIEIMNNSLINGDRNVNIEVNTNNSDVAWIEANYPIIVQDDEIPQLFITVPTHVNENDGVVSNQCNVSIKNLFINDLYITI